MKCHLNSVNYYPHLTLKNLMADQSCPLASSIIIGEHRDSKAIPVVIEKVMEDIEKEYPGSALNSCLMKQYIMKQYINFYQHNNYDHKISFKSILSLYFAINNNLIILYQIVRYTEAHRVRFPSSNGLKGRPKKIELRVPPYRPQGLVRDLKR